MLTTDNVNAMLEGANTNQDLSQKVDNLRKYVEASYLKVHVYFKSNSAEIIEEAPRYEKQQENRVISQIEASSGKRRTEQLMRRVSQSVDNKE